MGEKEIAEIPNSKRKLFFGLFIFPLVIAVGMAVLLCAVVLMTHEKQTPESLIGDIKKSSPGKRWQKAFELSNELNHSPANIREKATMNEITRILENKDAYDAKTRSYMALALSHFHEQGAITALRRSLRDPAEDVRLYAMWALGILRAKEAVADVLPYIKSDSADTRKTAVYVLGILGDTSSFEKLRPLLSDPAPDVGWNAALALARLGDASGLRVLIQMMSRDELETRYKMGEEQIESVMTNAAKGLALIRTPEATRILESVSKNDRSLKVRQAALSALQFQPGKTSS